MSSIKSLTLDQLRFLRARAQGLYDKQSDTVLDAVRRGAAIQAQAAAPARLAVRARSAGLEAADVDRACGPDGPRPPAVVRSWLMRGTLHMVPAAELRRLVALFGPTVAKGTARRRAELGLTEELCERALDAIGTVLAGGRALTRTNLVAELAHRGVVIDPKTQAPAHLVLYASARGLICRGPEQAADEPSYVLLDDWLPPGPACDRDEALAELARGYLAAYGPAALADFTAWSGLPAADTRRGFEAVRDETVEVESQGTTMLVARGTDLDAEPGHRVRLLGQFDALLLGYKTRDALVDPAFAKRVNAGGGMLSPVVLVDGHAAGTWRIDRTRKQPRLIVEPFTEISPAALDAVGADGDDVARFLGIAGLTIEAA